MYGTCDTHSVLERVGQSTLERCGGALHRFGNLLRDWSGHGPSESVPQDDASDPTSGLAQCRHPTQTDRTTSTGTSARTNSSATCHSISLSRTLLKTTFKCSVVIPEGPPAAPLRPCRTYFKNLSWSSENCVGPVSDQILWKWCPQFWWPSARLVRAVFVVSSPGGQVAPSSACLNRALPTQPMPVRVQPSCRRCQPVCDANATPALCASAAACPCRKSAIH